MLPWRSLVDSNPPAVHVPPGFSSDAVAHMVVQVLEVKLFYCQSRKCKNILRKSLQILCASDDYHWVADSYRTRSTQTALGSSRKEACLLDLLPVDTTDASIKVQDDALSTSTPSHEDQTWKRKHSRGTCTRQQDELHKNKKIQTSFSKHNVKLQTKPILVQDVSAATDSLFKSHEASECRLDESPRSNVSRNHAELQTALPSVQGEGTNTDLAEDGLTQTEVAQTAEVSTQMSPHRKRHVILQTRRVAVRNSSTNTESAETAVNHRFTQTLCQTEVEDVALQTDRTQRERASQVARLKVKVGQCAVQTDAVSAEVQTQTVRRRPRLGAACVQTCPTKGDASIQTCSDLKLLFSQETFVQTLSTTRDSSVQTDCVLSALQDSTRTSTRDYEIQTDLRFSESNVTDVAVYFLVVPRAQGFDW